MYKVTQSRLGARDPQVIEVDSPEAIGGQTYFPVRFFGQRVLLRNTGDGSIVMYDSNTKTESPWLLFATAEGQTFNTSLDTCTTLGKVESTNAKLTTPLGDFGNALKLSFSGRCADAGVTEEYYLPYVGLLRHVTTSIAGPVQYDLVYVRTGATTADAGQVAFSVALDAAVYRLTTDSANATVRLMLRNSTPDPLKLTFTSGQIYDAKIINEKGENVYTWSASRSFIQIIRNETLAAGERNYAFTVPIGNLPAGRYTLEGSLVSLPRYTATTSFEVVR